MCLNKHCLVKRAKTKTSFSSFLLYAALDLQEQSMSIIPLDEKRVSKDYLPDL